MSSWRGINDRSFNHTMGVFVATDDDDDARAFDIDGGPSHGSGLALHAPESTASQIGIYIACISRWPCDNTLASEANGPSSTPGAALELDTGCHSFVGRWNVQQLVNSGWLLLKIAVVNYQVWLCPCGYKTCGWRLKLCDSIKHGPCLSALWWVRS